MRSWTDEEMNSPLRGEAVEASRMFEDGYLVMGRKLLEVVTTHLDGDPDKDAIHVAWGYRTFREYVEAELPFTVSHARSLMRVVECLEGRLKDVAPALRTRFVALGSRKTIALSAVITQQTAQAWIDLAERVGSRDLDVAVKHYRRQVRALRKQRPDPATYRDPPVPAWVHMERLEFPLYPTQRALIDHALELASTLTGNRSRGLNLTLLAQEFVAQYDPGCVDTSQLRATFFRRLEELFHCKLAVRALDGTFLYGDTHDATKVPP